MPIRFISILFLLLVVLEIQAQYAWSKELPTIGTFSSPRVADLNGDGVGDVILGAGREEFIPSDSAIIALDGKSGELLWTVSARDQIFGSANLMDINDDGIQDIIINGRSAELQAISGKDGSRIWQFIDGEDRNLREEGWYNFYNAQFIPDQNGDQLSDILVSNGGDVLAEPYDSMRPPGHLMIIDAKSGALLKMLDTPDGKETYMSLVAVEDPEINDTKVVYGTGGETIGGHLFATTLSDILQDSLDRSIELATGNAKGFIGPPAWVDITGDNVHDLVACSVDGRMMAFDGRDYKKLWEAEFPNTETYSSLCIGQFTGDETPDFFISIAAGVWPKLEWNRQFMIDGSDGSIAYSDSLGFYQTSSGIAIDLNKDGREEVLLSVNYQEIDSLYRKFFRNMLVAINFETGEPFQISASYPGNNISSTPWIGDIDGNGKMDIIYVHATNERHTYTFDGMQVNLIPTDLIMDYDPPWGAYMGSYFDGVYRKSPP